MVKRGYKMRREIEVERKGSIKEESSTTTHLAAYYRSRHNLRQRSCPESSMSQSNGVYGSTVRYPAFLTEDAPRPPHNQRSIEPRERIDLLVQCIRVLHVTGNPLPTDVGTLFTLSNRALQEQGRGERIFNFVEFKAVVRCLVMDEGRGFGVASGRLFERRVGERRGQREGEAVGEEEVVGQVREAMAQVNEGGGVSVRVG